MFGTAGISPPFKKFYSDFYNISKKKKRALFRSYILFLPKGNIFCHIMSDTIIRR